MPRTCCPSIRQCNSDEETFKLCEQTRDAEVSLLANACERAMSDCAEYRNQKEARRMRPTKPAGEWERFFALADAGQNLRSTLGRVASIWGKEVVQHYSWESKGISFCNKLHTTAREVGTWEVAVTGLNLLMLEREDQSLQHRPIWSRSPVEARDLVYLRKNPRQE